MVSTSHNVGGSRIIIGYAASERGDYEGTKSTYPWLYTDVSTVTEKPLTNADRCDRCGAQAFIRVVLEAGELLFCAHHGRKHADAFRDIAVHVQDESDRLHE